MKVLTALLVLTLFGASSGPLVICAANCMPSVEGIVSVHHHQMNSQPGRMSKSDPVQAHHHDSACAECAPESGNRLDQKFACARLLQIEALRNGNFSLDEPSGVADFGVNQTPAYIAGLAPQGKQFSDLSDSRKIGSLRLASLPLRI